MTQVPPNMLFIQMWSKLISRKNLGYNLWQARYLVQLYLISPRNSFVSSETEPAENISAWESMTTVKPLFLPLVPIKLYFLCQYRIKPADKAQNKFDVQKVKQLNQLFFLMALKYLFIFLPGWLFGSKFRFSKFEFVSDISVLQGYKAVYQNVKLKEYFF